jgi:anti-sigma-K factor RskA
MLTVVLGLEWTAPLGGFAQSNPEPAPTSAAGVENQESPPMQEAAITEEPKPFYKKWWFWTIVAVVAVAVVGAIAIATADSEGCFGLDCVPPAQ